MHLMFEKYTANNNNNDSASSRSWSVVAFFLASSAANGVFGEFLCRRISYGAHFSLPVDEIDPFGFFFFICLRFRRSSPFRCAVLNAVHCLCGLPIFRPCMERIAEANSEVIFAQFNACFLSFKRISVLERVPKSSRC